MATLFERATKRNLGESELPEDSHLPVFFLADRIFYYFHGGYGAASPAGDQPGDLVLKTQLHLTDAQFSDLWIVLGKIMTITYPTHRLLMADRVWQLLASSEFDRGGKFEVGLDTWEDFLAAVDFEVAFYSNLGV